MFFGGQDQPDGNLRAGAILVFVVVVGKQARLVLCNVLLRALNGFEQRCCGAEGLQSEHVSGSRRQRWGEGISNLVGVKAIRRARGWRDRQGDEQGGHAGRATPAFPASAALPASGFRLAEGRDFLAVGA